MRAADVRRRGGIDYATAENRAPNASRGRIPKRIILSVVTGDRMGSRPRVFVTMED